MHKHRKQPKIIVTVSMISLDQSITSTVALILLIMMDFISCKVLSVVIALCKIKPRHYIGTLY